MCFLVAPCQTSAARRDSRNGPLNRNTMTRIRLWLTNLVRRHRFEDELAEELAFHIEARVASGKKRA